MNIIIRRLSSEAVLQLPKFFESVITEVFRQDGIADRIDDVAEEVSKQLGFVKQDQESQGKKVYFVCAYAGDKVVGTLALTFPSKFLLEHLPQACGVYEISSVYVKPDFQGQGIGSELFAEAQKILKAKGETGFCLDAGYRTSQPFWRKRLGKPQVCLKNYWGEGLDHLFWYKNL